MGTSASIDIEALLAPISDAAPAGVDLRQDTSASSIYFKLKDAARAARRAEKAADERDDDAGQGVVSEWQTVLTSAPTVLAEQSKDLEVAAWYTEALLRKDGFAGLRDGFAVLTGLVERYWDSFHSLPQEDAGSADRLAPVTGLNGADAEGTLIQPIRKVPITPKSGEMGPYSYFHYQMAATSGGGPRAKVTLDDFSAAVKSADGAYYATLIDDVEGALAQFETLGAALDSKAGTDAPPTSRILGLLVDIRDAIRAVSRDLVAAAQPAPEAVNPEEAAVAAPLQAVSAALAPAPTAVRTREDALRTLLQVADYFKNAEPQSPIATILEETVRRARLSFAELLVDLLPNDPAVDSILTNAGIRPPLKA